MTLKKNIFKSIKLEEKEKWKGNNITTFHNVTSRVVTDSADSNVQNHKPTVGEAKKNPGVSCKGSGIGSKSPPDLGVQV